MLTILFSVLVGWILSLFNFDNLIGVHGSMYYLAWAVFGAVAFLIEKLKG